MGVIYYLRGDKETKTNLLSQSIILPQACLAVQDERGRDRNAGGSALTLIHKYTDSLEEPQTYQNVGNNLINAVRYGLGDSTIIDFVFLKDSVFLSVSPSHKNYILPLNIIITTL